MKKEELLEIVNSSEVDKFPPEVQKLLGGDAMVAIQANPLTFDSFEEARSFMVGMRISPSTIREIVEDPKPTPDITPPTPSTPIGTLPQPSGLAGLFPSFGSRDNTSIAGQLQEIKELLLEVLTKLE